MICDAIFHLPNSNSSNGSINDSNSSSASLRSNYDSAISFLQIFVCFCWFLYYHYHTTYCCCCWLNFNCARKISFSQQSTRYVGTYEYIRHPAPGCMRHVLSIALRTQLTIIVGSHWKVRKCPFAIMQTIHRIPIASKSMLQQIMGWMWIRLSFLRRCLPICVLYVHYLKTNLNMYNVYFHNCERK